MTRLVLTIDQARNLQRSISPWPADWTFLFNIQAPEKLDTLADPQRMTAGLVMLERGCTDEQIAEQLGWKPDSSPLRQLRRLHKSRLPSTSHLGCCQSGKPSFDADC